MKAPVFDFGGVMTTSTMPQRVKAEAAALGIPWNAVVEGFGKYRHAYDGGEISLRELYERTWRDNDLSVSAADTERIVEADRASWLYRNERTLAWMRELKAQGRRIGILTNMAPDFATLFKKHFADYIELADAMVISGYEHMFKPQRQIYDLLRTRIGLPASDLVFFDDVEENCQGARDAGWSAIRFVTNEQAEKDFAAL